MVRSENCARQRIVLWQTMSNSLTPNDSMPTDCLVKVVKVTGYTKGRPAAALSTKFRETGGMSSKHGPTEPGETWCNLVGFGTPSRHSISGSAPGGNRSRRTSEEPDPRYCASDCDRSSQGQAHSRIAKQLRQPVHSP